MFRRYSPSATEPSPSVPFSMALRSAFSLPGFTRALTKYRILLLYYRAQNCVMLESGMEGPVFDETFRKQFENLLKWRRDVRNFRREPVDPRLIEHLIGLASLAPSVGYSQPWRYILVESEE